MACTSKDTEKLVHMYKIYLQSGKGPTARTINTVNINTTVKIEGEALALMNYESCWRDKPPCDDEADYQVVPIEVITSFLSISRNYGGDYNAAITECFMKLGASGTYKAKNKP